MPIVTGKVFLSTLLMPCGSGRKHAQHYPSTSTRNFHFYQLPFRFQSAFYVSFHPTSEKIVACQLSCKMDLPAIMGHSLAKITRSAGWCSVFCMLEPLGLVQINSLFSQGLPDCHRRSSPCFVTVHQQGNPQIPMK